MRVHPDSIGSESGYTNGGFPAVGGEAVTGCQPAAGTTAYLASALASMSWTEAVVIGW